VPGKLAALDGFVFVEERSGDTILTTSGLLRFVRDENQGKGGNRA
jgi:hypothetical protein